MMRHVLFIALLLLSYLTSQAQQANAWPALLAPRHTATATCTTIDTLLDVGSHRLHFHILTGSAQVILFESGGGDDWTEWHAVLQPIQRATGATLVAYDRAGFGTSELDSTQISLSEQISALKTGLAKLHLDRAYLLVAHSFGGYFSTLFAATYPTQVKGVVLVDATQVAFWTDAQVNSFLTEYASVKATTHHDAPGRYWMYVGMPAITRQMRQTSFPTAIPAVLLLPDRSPFATADETTRWRLAQQQFVAGAPNRRLKKVANSGHYIMLDQPTVVVNTVVALHRAIWKAAKK